MMTVKINAFKESGKYYSEDTVEITDCTAYEIMDNVRTALDGRFGDMILTTVADKNGDYPGGYPMMSMPE